MTLQLRPPRAASLHLLIAFLTCFAASLVARDAQAVTVTAPASAEAGDTISVTIDLEAGEPILSGLLNLSFDDAVLTLTQLFADTTNFTVASGQGPGVLQVQLLPKALVVLSGPGPLVQANFVVAPGAATGAVGFVLTGSKTDGSINSLGTAYNEFAVSDAATVSVVGATVVPLPAGAWLLIVGIGALGAVRTRRA